MEFGKDHIEIFVAAVCHDGQGHFLMGKRGGEARDRHGFWEFPGGTLEHGESLEASITREITEECGVAPTNLEQVSVHEYIQDGQHYLGIYFTADIDREKVYIAEPVYDELGWFTLETLPTEGLDHDSMDEIAEYIKHFKS